MQYHSLIEKKKGEEMYSKFCELIKKTYQEKLESIAKTSETKNESKEEQSNSPNNNTNNNTDNNTDNVENNNNNNKPQVQCGVYGNRQGLKFESRGPFTHVLLGTDE